MDLEAIQSLSGVEFEDYLYEVFKDMGYCVQKTRATGDFGVDLLLESPGSKIAVQAKRYKKNVGFKAVQEVHTGMHYYDATEAWIVTTSSFSKQAIEGADKLGVQLIDASGISELETISNSNDIALEEIKKYRSRYSEMIKDLERKLHTIKPLRQYLEDILYGPKYWFESFKSFEDYAKEKWPTVFHNYYSLRETYIDFTSSNWMILPDGSRTIEDNHPEAVRLTTYCGLDKDAEDLFVSFDNAKNNLTGLLEDLRSPKSWKNRAFQETLNYFSERITQTQEEIGSPWTRFNEFYEQTERTLDLEKHRIVEKEERERELARKRELLEKGQELRRSYLEECNAACEEYRKFANKHPLLLAFSPRWSKLEKELISKLERLYSSYIFNVNRIDPKHLIIKPVQEITINSVNQELFQV